MPTSKNAIPKSTAQHHTFAQMSSEPATRNLAPDAVDPKLVPTRTLATGAKIPVVGLGTFGSDHVTGERIAEAVLDAAARRLSPFRLRLRLRQRASDRPFVPENSRRRREARGFLDHLQSSGTTSTRRRTSSPPAKNRCADLQLDYLDLYLVHWPFPNFHPPGCAAITTIPMPALHS